MDSDQKGEMGRLFGLGRGNLEAVWQDESYRNLHPGEQLHVISALGVKSFADYVREADRKSNDKRPLEDILLEWEQSVETASEEEDIHQLMQIYDQLLLSDGALSDEMSAALCHTKFNRPFSISMYVGINTLGEMVSQNMFHEPADFRRFMAATVNSHILDGRYDSIDQMLTNSVADRLAFWGQRMRIKTILATKGILFSRGNITRTRVKSQMLSRVQKPRTGCSLLLAGELRYFLDREHGALYDF